MPWEAWTLIVAIGIECLFATARYGNEPPKNWGSGGYVMSQLAEWAFLAWLVLRLGGAA